MPSTVFNVPNQLTGLRLILSVVMFASFAMSMFTVTSRASARVRQRFSRGSSVSATFIVSQFTACPPVSHRPRSRIVQVRDFHTVSEGCEAASIRSVIVTHLYQCPRRGL